MKFKYQSYKIGIYSKILMRFFNNKSGKDNKKKKVSEDATLYISSFLKRMIKKSYMQRLVEF